MSNSFVTPWTVAHQVPLSMQFTRQEYWSGLPFPSPEDLPNPEIKRMSPALVDGFFTTKPLGKTHYISYRYIIYWFIIFKGYSSFIVIIKYWLNSPCYTIYSSNLLYLVVCMSYSPPTCCPSSLSSLHC